jgi:hypothetical protein
MPYAIQPTQMTTDISAANTEKTLTVADPGAGRKIYVTQFEAIVSDAAAGASPVNVILKDGTTAKWTEIIPASSAIGYRISINFQYPVEFAGAVNLVSDAAGSGSKIRLNLAYFIG